MAKYTFKLVFDSEWTEYIVKVSKEGVRKEDLDYHTDDREDAENTMDAMDKELNQRTDHDNAVHRTIYNLMRHGVGKWFEKNPDVLDVPLTWVTREDNEIRFAIGDPLADAVQVYKVTIEKED